MCSASVDLASQSVLQIKSCMWLGLTIGELTEKKSNLKNAIVSCCEKSLLLTQKCVRVDMNTVNRFFRCRILFVVPEMLEQRYKVKFYQRVCVRFSPLLRQQSSQQVSSLAINP